MRDNKKFKIAIIGNSDSPHVAERVRRLKKYDKFIIEIFDGSKDWNPSNKNGHFVRNFKKKIPKLTTISWLKRRYDSLKSFEPDLIFVMYADSYSLFLASIMNVKYIVSAWGGDILREQGALDSLTSRMMTRRGLSKADGIFTVSKHLKDSISSLMGKRQYPEPTILFYGIDLKKYSPESVEREKMDEDSTIVFYSPRWALPIYNSGSIVDAFIHVYEKTKRVSLIYRNTDYVQSVESRFYSKQLSKKIEQAGLSNNTKAVGLLSEEHRIELLQSADVVLSFSQSDGTPLSVLEAMALGKIVVCHRIPSTEALIEQEKNGFLVDIKQPEQVVDTLYYITKNFDSIRDKIGNTARNFVEEHANIELEIENYVEKFDQCVSV